MVWASGFLKAFDSQINTEVAIKMLSDKNTCKDDLLRFIREAKVMAQINHPNIVKNFTILVRNQGHPFIVMEFIDGIFSRLSFAKIKN